eukprot:TRINITY_DN2122_c0_g1_i1.p3 TRINITY_DN2122_c0_g1~~TRINITY_DN2122_c0_g1_i1.p3  ORF type:complete len:119 (+),score=26.80 TRINITY_DN2122_c0_g1_i1:617-973(+)
MIRYLTPLLHQQSSSTRASCPNGRSLAIASPAAAAIHVHRRWRNCHAELVAVLRSAPRQCSSGQQQQQGRHQRRQQPLTSRHVLASLAAMALLHGSAAEARLHATHTQQQRVWHDLAW